MSKWEMAKLGEVCTIVSGSTPKTGITEYWNGDYYWITPAEINDSSKFINNTERKITNKAVQDTSLKLLPQGTVLLSSRAPIGKVAICGTSMYCNQGFKNLICSVELYNVYLYWYLKGRTDYLNSLGRGATFKEISKSIVENVEIALPPLEVQIQIAQNLDTVSELLALRKKQLEELDELIKSVFYDMFGDSIEDQDEWEVKNLHELCIDIVDCPHSTPLYSETKTNFPAIRTSEIKNGSIDWSSMKYVDEKVYLERIKRITPQKNDIIYGREGSFGDAVILPGEFQFCMGQRVMLLRSDSTVCNHIFLWYTIRSELVYGQAKEKNIGATVGRVNVKDIKEFKLFVPPLALQNQFASIVTKIEEQKALVKQSIEETQQLFDSLMSQYFD